jgi:outer membrane protein assembly factor BamB
VWIASRKDGGGRTRQAVLYAFDASNLGQPIYSSETNDGRDGAGMAARFVIPMVVNGRVYLGTRSEVEVYGLLK